MTTKPPDMTPKVDDVGSFPFPPYVNRATFAENYFTFYKYCQQDDPPDHRGWQVNFAHPIAYTFRMKLETGLDVVNYPQLFDMHDQFMVPIKEYETDPFRIDPAEALVPEVRITEMEARRWHEETGERVKLKACVTGPIELYLRTKFGFTVYEDAISALADSVNAFLQSCMVDTPYMKTEVVAIDEPSLGYVDLFNATDADLVTVLDRATRGLDCDVQVHLHSLAKANIPLETAHIDCLTCEYASNPNNVIPRRQLEAHDKFIRVGICRTDFNSILAEHLDAGESYESVMQDPGRCIQAGAEIRQNLDRAVAHYGDRLTYVGPDCGLSAWGPPELAQQLLARTVKVVRDAGFGPSD